MSLILAHPYEIFEWSEEVIKIILRNKKVSKSIGAKLKEFASKFLKYSNSFI